MARPTNTAACWRRNQAIHRIPISHRVGPREYRYRRFVARRPVHGLPRPPISESIRQARRPVAIGLVEPPSDRRLCSPLRRASPPYLARLGTKKDVHKVENVTALRDALINRGWQGPPICNTMKSTAANTMKPPGRSASAHSCDFSFRPVSPQYNPLLLSRRYCSAFTP